MPARIVRAAAVTQLQTMQRPVEHEHAGRSGAIVLGRHRRSQSRATPSLRSSDPPGQHALWISEATRLTSRLRGDPAESM
jgi:hypothetical protein